MNDDWLTCAPAGRPMRTPPPLQSRIPTSAEFYAYNKWMASLGPRFPGCAAHQRFVDHVQQRMDALVQNNPDLSTVPDDAGRVPGPIWFRRWEAHCWGLRLGGRTVPVAGYVPHCGLTSRRGISAQLVWGDEAPLRWRPGFMKKPEPFVFGRHHRQKIVAIKMPTRSLRVALLKLLTLGTRSDLRNCQPFARPITLEEQTPHLDAAQRAGVEGLVLVLDMSPDHARGQYVPFLREQGGVPALHVDCRQEQFLKDNEGRYAELVLTGTSERAENRYLIYELEGEDADAGAVLLLTHTDGPSAFEENGSIALMWLAARFASLRRADRRRSILFAFVPAHFHASGGSTRQFLRQYSHLTRRIRRAIGIEHLGTWEWPDSCGTPYRGRRDAAGQPVPELSLVSVSNRRGIYRWARRMIVPRGQPPLLRRPLLVPSRYLMKALLGWNFFGEGRHTHDAGIPTLGFLPTSNDIFSWWDSDRHDPTNRGHVQKLQPDRAVRECQAMFELARDLVNR